MICVGVMLLTCIIFAGDQVPIKVDKDSSGYLHLPVLRSRVPSYHMRELARGQFMVKSKDITLSDCIGEGQLVPPEAHVYIICASCINVSYVGEFGIVYKAKMLLSKPSKVKA